MRPRLLMVVLALGAGLLAAGVAPPDAALAANGYATADVNMRTGPGVNYPRIAVIPRGAAVTIRGCVRSHRWCDVSWRGWRGWVSARYLAWMRYRRPIYRPGYPPLWGGPIIHFHFGRYHDRWYRDRPWYRKHHWHPPRHRRVIRRHRPLIHPGQPVIRRDRPLINPGQPVIRRDRPLIHPIQPLIHPDQPVIRRDRPAIRWDRPAHRREKPIIRRGEPERRAEWREWRQERHGGDDHACFVRRGHIVCR